MLTAVDVQRVAHTAQPHTAPGGATLSIDDIVKLTVSADWDGDLFKLRDAPAADIAADFNAAHGLHRTIIVEPGDVLPASR